MSVLGNTIGIARTSIVVINTTSVISKALRRISSIAPCSNQSSSSFSLTIPSTNLIISNGFNIQFTRHTSQSASLAKAMQNAAKPLVICGPSGAGKSSIVNKVTEEFPDCFGLCVSHTTRKPRRDMYGTSRGAINRVQMAGMICVLDIEMHGVHQIKKTPGVEPHYVFIKPPSIEELEVRLRERKTETEESLQKRLARAGEEMEYGATDGNFDLVITNNNLDDATSALRDFMIVHIEELKRFRKL